MGKVLLSLHVLAGIVFIGPVTVAASLFPRYARLAVLGDGEAPGQTRAGALPVLTLLHRISTVYAVLGLSVPAFGLAVANQLGVLTDAWLLVSIVLTLAAALLLAFGVIPAQRRVLAAARSPEVGDPGPWSRVLGRLAGVTGVFALLWAVVVVLMIVRPGSTTGV